MPLRITFSTSSDQIAGRFRANSDKALQAIANKLTELMIRLQSKIVVEKMSGQVLRRITGIAAGSIRAIAATITGTAVSAEVQGGGGPAYYLKYQEFGTNGPYDILPSKAKALHFLIGGNEIFARKVTHPGLPARRPMGQAFEEFTPQIIAGLRETLTEVLSQ